MKLQGELKDYLKAAAGKPPRGQAVPCLDEEQMAAFYAGQLGDRQADAVRDHLVECPACREMARDARQFVHAMTEPKHTTTSASAAPWYRRHERKLWLLAAAVLIAVALPLLVRQIREVEAPSEQQAERPAPRPSPTSDNPWQNLEIAKAEYVPASQDDLVWRDEPGRPKSSSDDLFAEGMRLYQLNSFAVAQRRLAQFLRRNPQHAEAYFYRGVSLLLLDKTMAAIAPLEAAVKHSRGQFQQEAQWYLAQAYLKAGEPAKAREQLEAVIAAKGKRQAEAEKLRGQIK
jgi:tetratricopeptide (TPR) repeat protein